MKKHIPVLLGEAMYLLAPKNGEVYFDGTFGGGGYTKAILEAANCKVIATDRDDSVRDIAVDFKAKYNDRFHFHHARFSNIKNVITSMGMQKVDGIILDLGVSNFQLLTPERGFSFKLKGELDMRMGLSERTARDLIVRCSEIELANLIYIYGGERHSRRIAKNIKLHLNEIKNTDDLANVVRRCLKRNYKIDSATKTFQALRICVNNELNELEAILKEAKNLLNPNGRIIVVSFHSLEDRIVKSFFKEISSKDGGTFNLLTKKPIVPGDGEIICNPKSRSAKLRAVCMLEETQI